MNSGRRTFIKHTTTAAASLSVLPTLMNASCIGANNRVVVGLIGCNSQGFVVRLGRKLFWDAEKQEFKNDPEANALTKAVYRAPWSLPVI